MTEAREVRCSSDKSLIHFRLRGVAPAEGAAQYTLTPYSGKLFASAPPLDLFLLRLL